jgi:hypothetical protein
MGDGAERGRRRKGLSAILVRLRGTLWDEEDGCRFSHSQATTGNISARPYVARPYSPVATLTYVQAR